jgi:aspartyl-tRNA(Asn)/glutamyl-tRNA(Gln) amidotransferase subunit C
MAASTHDIDAATVHKIAHLARLPVDAHDIQKTCAQLTNILHMIDQLEQADTTNIAPMFNAFAASTPRRSDEVTETNERECLQSIAPQKEAGLFLVPKVIEGER